MSKYDRIKEIVTGLSDFAKKHNVTIMTATQPKKQDAPVIDRKKQPNEMNIVIIDHTSLIE